MDGVVARDPRVAQILSRPDDYFDQARARAWLAAGRDIVADLGRRESQERSGRRRTARAHDRGRD